MTLTLTVPNNHKTGANSEYKIYMNFDFHDLKFLSKVMMAAAIQMVNV